MNKLFIYMLVGLIFTSCASISELTIDVQKPAKITLPNSSSRIVVANNSADQPADINHTIYQYTRAIETFEVPSDGLGNILIEALVDNLIESTVFEGVFIELNLSQDIPSFLEKRELKKEEVDSVLLNYDADVLLTLDRYIILLSTDMQNIGDNVSHDFYVANIQADFSLYDKSGVKWGAPIQYRDTLFWSAYRQGGYPLSAPLPTYRETLEESMYHIASTLNGYLAPQWINVNRWIYSSAATDMRRASVDLGAGRWDKARDIWMKAYEEESKPQKKAWLSSNIALTYELTDELELALEWARNAQNILLNDNKKDESRNFRQISHYVKELEDRILDFKLLDLQNYE